MPSSRGPSGSRLKTGFLKLLARPYLAAAPTGVTASHGDGEHGTLRISVAATHGAGLIEVAWPAYTVGEPALRSSCGAVSQGDMSGARLSIEVPAGAACSLQLAAA